MMHCRLGRLADPWPHSDGHPSNAPMLEAHVEKRKLLTARVKAENPSYTELDVEARLEQFVA
jgi:hypothetical protein